MFDARILRDRQQAAHAAAERAAPLAEDGSIALLVQTRTLATYPTTANAFFACSPVRIDGAESEGAAATFAVDFSRTHFVYNLGTQIPPVGARLLAQSGAGRWTFRYDG